MGDKPLPEYLVAYDSAANRLSCWIPSEEGQKFAVCWRDHGSKVDSCGFITLDGQIVPGRFLFGEGFTQRSGFRTSRTTERPFEFQKVPDIAGDTIDQAANKETGMIILRIKRVVRISSRPPNLIQDTPPAFALGKRRPGDICVGLGEETESPQYGSTWHVVPHGEDSRSRKVPSTYVSFVFRYRTAEFLEAQGIFTERKPITVPSRRVASLPPSMIKAESPSSGLPMLPKLTTAVTNHYPNASYRWPSIELRRTVSWKATATTSNSPGVQRYFVLGPGLELKVEPGQEVDYQADSLAFESAGNQGN